VPAIGLFQHQQQARGEDQNDGGRPEVAVGEDGSQE